MTVPAAKTPKVIQKNSGAGLRPGAAGTAGVAGFTSAGGFGASAAAAGATCAVLPGSAGGSCKPPSLLRFLETAGVGRCLLGRFGRRNPSPERPTYPQA